MFSLLLALNKVNAEAALISLCRLYEKESKKNIFKEIYVRKLYSLVQLFPG